MLNDNKLKIIVTAVAVVLITGVFVLASCKGVDSSNKMSSVSDKQSDIITVMETTGNHTTTQNNTGRDSFINETEINTTVSITGEGTIITGKQSDTTKIQDTKKDTTKQTTADDGPVPAFTDKNVTITKSIAEIKNKGSEIKLEAGDNLLRICSFKLPGTNNVIKNNSRFSLPLSYKKGNSVIPFIWKYQSAKPYIEEAVSGIMSGVTFTYRDNSTVLKVTCRYYMGVEGPYEFFSVIINEDKNNILILQPGSFASFDFIGADSNILFYFSKESGSAERFRQSNGAIVEGCGSWVYRIQDKQTHNIWSTTDQGWNASGYFPMAYIETGGHGLYIALEWSSGRVNVTGVGKDINVSVDMDEISVNRGKFLTKVPCGEKIQFPTVYLGGYTSGLEVGSNGFKRWFRSCKSPDNIRTNPCEPLTQMDMQSGLDTHGVEAIKLDYGW